MTTSYQKILESNSLTTSAPCRVDLGGTLDISTFYYPLRLLKPLTFNIALDLRTKVRLSAYKKGFVKISSKGFESAAYALKKAPFDHPLGLMFAIATYFNIDGIHIDIASSSPPRSALGGSSVAAVALIAGLLNLLGNQDISKLRYKIAVLAHQIESSVAGVPCGLQDQLAAAYGGVNAWYWSGEVGDTLFSQKVVVPKNDLHTLKQHFLVAYCGAPHESKNINSRWVKQFISGKNREMWREIVLCTHKFVKAFASYDFNQAAIIMNQETKIRTEMTPDVVDDMGKKLIKSAAENGCGARFTGAGGGGCVWAVGDISNIERLRQVWSKLILAQKSACLLDPGVDSKGVCVD